MHLSHISSTMELEQNVCQLCNGGLLYQDVSVHERHSFGILKSLSTKLFHEECTTCAYPIDVNRGLCEFCQNSRVTHLLHYVDFTERPFDNIYIRFCRFEDVGTRANSMCSFCRLLIHSAMPYASPDELIHGHVGFSINDRAIFTRRHKTEGWSRWNVTYYQHDTAAQRHIKIQEKFESYDLSLTISNCHGKESGIDGRWLRRRPVFDQVGRLEDLRA